MAKKKVRSNASRSAPAGKKKPTAAGDSGAKRSAAKGPAAKGPAVKGPAAQRSDAKRRPTSSNGTESRVSSSRRASASWGGARTGSGRKAAVDKRGERIHPPHVAREEITPNRPVIVRIHLAEDLPNITSKRLAAVIEEVLQEVRDDSVEYDGFRLRGFALQPKELHLTCTANDNGALSLAMRGINGRLAKAVNRVLGRRGRFIRERYEVVPMGSSGATSRKRAR